jgi:hypothetical protein
MSKAEQKAEASAEKKAGMLSAGLAKTSTQLVKSEVWTTLDFLARLDERQAEALPPAIRDAYEKTLREAGAKMASENPQLASEVVKGVDCEQVIVTGFGIYETEGGAAELERKTAAIGRVRLKKQEERNGETTVWMRFAAVVDGREAGVWGAMNVGKWWRVKLKN